MGHGNEHIKAEKELMAGEPRYEEITGDPYLKCPECGGSVYTMTDGSSRWQCRECDEIFQIDELKHERED